MTVRYAVGGVIPQCPRCHQTTEFVELRHYGEDDTLAAVWCKRCLQRNIAEVFAEQVLWP